jgi:hypothetical protein
MAEIIRMWKVTRDDASRALRLRIIWKLEYILTVFVSRYGSYF